MNSYTQVFVVLLFEVQVNVKHKRAPHFIARLELISKYQITAVESLLRQKLRSYYKRSVLHEQSGAWKTLLTPFLYRVD